MRFSVPTPDELRIPNSERPAVSRFVAVCAAVAVGFADNLGATERYVALFEDGARIQASDVKDWNDPRAQPRIGDRLLFDVRHPLRWLIDRQQWFHAPAAAYVELAGGDCLPGEVVAFQSGRESPFEESVPHLLVRPKIELQPPDEPEPGQIRVQLDSVRRVVWEARSGEPYRPGTALLRNGGNLAFRSLRWQSSGVVLLVDDGIREFAFADLAELHLAVRDPWVVYMSELAVLLPGGTGRLLQWDTVDGGRFTASTQRFQARHWGDKNRPDTWHHLVQPAWSLDPLWIRFRSVHTWRSWAAHEPPLGRFGPQRVHREAVFSDGWTWQADRSSQGGRLRIADAEFGGGFGVHASTDLVFDWPEYASAVRVTAGLDPAAGHRGCVDFSVLDAEGRPLFQRERVLGSKEIVSTGWLAVPRSAGVQRRSSITLRTDMAARAGAEADPFDIRDVATWADPQVQLDPEIVRQIAARHVVAGLPGLAGWTIAPAELAGLQTLSLCDVTDAREPRFRTVFRTPDRFALFTRSLQIGSHDCWLSLIVSRFSEHSASFVQVKINGVSCGEFEVPLRQGPIDPDPILIPIAEHRGQTVSVEVTWYPGDANAWLDWRGVAVTAERPGIRVLYEDQLQLEGFAMPPGVEVVSGKPFTGTACLRLSPGVAAEFPIAGGEAVIAEQPRLGQYHFMAFAWRGESTSGLSLQLGHDGRFGPRIADALIGRPVIARPGRSGRSRKLEDRGLRYGYAYDTGSYQPLNGSPLRLNRDVSADWKLETRDLFNDFGPLIVSGFAVQCHERGAGWFDHLYLARTPQDLDYVRNLLQPAPAPKEDATYSHQAVRPEDWGPAVARFAPQFATRAASHGILQKREHFGQTDGWQTHPQDKDQPFVLRSGLVLPADRPQELDLRVSHQPQRDWRLAVRVNGERIYERMIDDALTAPQRGWASLQVDLSAYRGQKVLIEILNESNDWNQEHAFWKHVAVRDRGDQ